MPGTSVGDGRGRGQRYRCGTPAIAAGHGAARCTAPLSSVCPRNRRTRSRSGLDNTQETALYCALIHNIIRIVLMCIIFTGKFDHFLRVLCIIRIILYYVLTPKPSLLAIANKLLSRRSRPSRTARLDGAGCCCEAAHLKRTGQGYIAISGSSPLRPHPRQRQPCDCRCKRPHGFAP